MNKRIKRWWQARKIRKLKEEEDFQHFERVMEAAGGFTAPRAMMYGTMEMVRKMELDIIKLKEQEGTNEMD